MTSAYVVPVPPASPPPSTGILRVHGDQIVGTDGKPILLKGAGLGGHLNMENFISGYPGHEFQMRKAMLRALGQERYDFFFDKFLEYFFAEEDAKFVASLGLNCIRIPINYRHLEDDMCPGVYVEKGFLWIDRIVNLCAAEGIYTILDLHSAPGGQNPDWHCDSGVNESLFWRHVEFQDRAINIWKAFAARYAGNAWVAGYNPLNEPCDEEHTRLLAWYERVERAIRSIDRDHILFLDGNTFAADFSQFKEPLPNSVYSCHDYALFGFPAGQRYKGTAEQKAKLESTLQRKMEYQQNIGGPVWNGEWGPVYANAEDGPDWEDINTDRFRLVQDQLSLYNEKHISWSIWLYKDIGFQGMIYASPESTYLTHLKPFLTKKKRLAADAWGADKRHVSAIFEPIESWMEDAAPELDQKYPSTWNARRHIRRVLREMLLSEALTPQYASYFAKLTKEELEQMAGSFKFENCLQRDQLNETLRQLQH